MVREHVVARRHSSTTAGKCFNSHNKQRYAYWFPFLIFFTFASGLVYVLVFRQATIVSCPFRGIRSFLAKQSYVRSRPGNGRLLNRHITSTCKVFLTCRWLLAAYNCTGSMGEHWLRQRGDIINDDIHLYRSKWLTALWLKDLGHGHAFVPGTKYMQTIIQHTFRDPINDDRI